MQWAVVRYAGGRQKCIGSFCLLQTLGFEQVLVHQALGQRLIVIANRLVDAVVHVGDGAKIPLAIGRASASLVEEGRYHLDERGEDPIAGRGGDGTMESNVAKKEVLQLRADLLNAPNAAGIINRNSTLALSNRNDPVTNVAPVFDPVTGLLNNGINLTSTGAVSPDRSKPKNAGFGVATAYQTPRNVQLQVRFSF
jgi:hypothetical protein